MGVVGSVSAVPIGLEVVQSFDFDFALIDCPRFLALNVLIHL